MKPYGSIACKVNCSGIYVKKEFLNNFRYGQEQCAQYTDKQIAVNGIDDNGQSDLLTSGNMPDHEHGNKHVEAKNDRKEKSLNTSKTKK